MALEILKNPKSHYSKPGGERVLIENKMLTKFPQSKQLKDLIESHEWSLYDSTVPKGRRTAFTWEEFQEKGPAKEFVTGNNYIFAPIPKNGETLRQAYSHTKGVGPCIQLDNIDQHIDMDGDGAHIVDGKMTYIFTRLGVKPYRKRDAVGLFTPADAMPNMPVLIIPFEFVLDKFQKHFRIISPEEYHGRLQYPDIRDVMN